MEKCSLCLTRDLNQKKTFCNECCVLVGRVSRFITGFDLAKSQVSIAIKNGDLPRLDGSIKCVDCSKPAKNYDHRDYNKPLDVSPVCISCNVKRGTAKWHKDKIEYLFLRIWRGPGHAMGDKKSPNCADCGEEIIRHRKGRAVRCWDCSYEYSKFIDRCRLIKKKNPDIYLPLIRVLEGPQKRPSA